jgi:hypothetical protein
MRLNNIISILLLSITQILAQDIGTTEVKVVEGFKPSISEASRLNENAVFADTIKKDRNQTYEVKDVDLQSGYETKPLKAAKVKDDKIPELYGTKVGLGFGNAWATKASVVHNSKRSKTLSYGVIANHFANYFSPSNFESKNSKNALHLYGKKISSKYIFNANLEYDRRTSLYWSKNSSLPTEENYRNRFAYTKLSVSALLKEADENKIKHHTTFFVSDFNEFSEIQIHLGTELEKTINGLPFALEIELNDYLNYNGEDKTFESSDVKSLHFLPKTSFEKFGFDFEVGLELDYEIGSNANEFEISPQIKASKELVKDVLLVYGGLRHADQRHTLKSLSDVNPYIHSYGTNQSILVGQALSQDLEKTDTDEMYVGIRNILGKDEVFCGSFSYSEVNNFAHFVRENNGNYNRFRVVYLESVRQLHANANYERKLNSIISLNVAADYYNWDKEVYHKPNFTASLSAPVNLREKIKAVPIVSYMGVREVLGAEFPAQIHANLGVYYFYSKQLSAYLQFNNITDSKQDLWQGYQEVGFNGLLGLNYSF